MSQAATGVGWFLCAGILGAASCSTPASERGSEPRTSGAGGNSGATSSGTAGGGGTQGAGTGGTGIIVVDAGRSVGDACATHCSSDLHGVLDCNNGLIQTCPPEQGCAAGACVPAC